MPASGHRTEPLRVALLAVPAAAGSALYGIVDVLSSVGRDFEAATGAPPADEPLVRPVIVSVDGAALRIGNRLWVEPDMTLADLPQPDVVCVPDLYLDLDAPPHGLFPQEVAWLRAVHARGAVVCSVCSGTLLLAEAGLLDGGEATTHWAFCDLLARSYPKVTVRPSQVLVPAGPEHRVVTSGGASSWHDLLLYLIGRYFGAEQALRVAKVHLLQWHSDGQSPYASLSRALQHSDAAIAACQEWLADHYAEPGPVAAMVALSHLPERTFKRRFHRATGLSPIEYVQNLRVEEAKQLLETTDGTVEQIALATGYDDPAFFRRLFNRKVGIAPAAYRRRFRPLVRIARLASARDGPQARLQPRTSAEQPS